MRRTVSFMVAAILIIAAGGCATASPTAPAASAPQTAAQTPSPSSTATQTPSASPTATQLPSSGPTATQAATNKKLFTITIKIDSKEIAKNIIGENPVRTCYIKLPPSYYSSDKKYPVVYFVNGFSSGTGYMLSRKMGLDSAMKDAGGEFIAVDVDASNKYGGSFLTNSPVTGNWENYFMDELIPYIDSNYRTIPDSTGRGISGFSMGGYVALNLAMKHPDVFCATYAVCPGVFDENGLSDALKTWQPDPAFLTAYGQTFCPMPDDKANNYMATPAMDGSEKDKQIVEKWESGFGDLQQKIDAYLALKTPLKAIGIEYGTNDGYGWIPKGCVYFSGLLDKAQIKHTIKSFPGVHEIPSSFIRDSFVPFFLEVFGK